MADKFGGRYGGPQPVFPRIGGSAAAYVPIPSSAEASYAHWQVAPGLHLAGKASANPWMGLAQALNAHMAGRIGPGVVGSGGWVGGGFGTTASGRAPTRRTIYGPGPRAF